MVKLVSSNSINIPKGKIQLQLQVGNICQEKGQTYEHIFLLWNNSATNTTERCIGNSVHRRTLLGTVPERKTSQFFQRRRENLSNKSVIVKSIKNMKMYVIFCVVLCCNG